MNIPNFTDIKFVNEDGNLTDTWRQTLSQLFTELQKNTSNEGLVSPSQNVTNIGVLAPNIFNGTLIYDETNNNLAAKINGSMRYFQFSSNSFLFPNMSVITDGGGNLTTGVTTAAQINYLSNVTSDAQSQLDAKALKATQINTSSPLSGGGDLSANRTISIPAANATTNGYLTSIDWSSFSAKVSASRTISTTAPLQGGGDLSADRTLSITQSGVSSDGYLSSTDWNIFYAKEPAITSGTIAQYWRGDKTWQTLNATAVGLGNVTNDAQTKADIVPNTLPASGQILVGNAGGTAYAPQTMSTDVTLTSTGVATIANNAVTNAKLSQAGANTYKGNNTGITANVSDISTNTAFNQSFETLTTNVKPIGTVNVGALNTLPRADHIHPFSVSPPLLYNALTGALSLGTRSFPLDIETNGIYGNYRSRSIGAGGNFNFNFKIPQDFNALIDLYIEGFVSAGAAGINKNIDISVEYCNGSAQLSNQFTASDTTTVYNLTGLTGRLFRISVASLLTNLTPGTVGGINIRHTTLGGGIDYVKGLVIYV
jgi:hypothetical protein